MGKRIYIIFFILCLILGAGIGGPYFYKLKARKKIDAEKKKIEERISSYLEIMGVKERPEILSFGQEANLFKIKLRVRNQEAEFFVSRDGNYLFPIAVPLSEVEKMKKEKRVESQNKEVEKRERPDVKLFVMSYCPFGLQMEKALLPVWELLKGKAEIGIYFVDYIMHGKKEMEENLRQYCLQKEDKEKYISYLKCFTKEGNSERCLKEAKVPEGRLKECEERTDKEFKVRENFKETGYPPFNIHKELNERFGVQGSPHLVINDQPVVSERSPEKIKEAICNTFLQPPEECSQKLSEESPGAGFGTQGGSGGGGSCQ